MSTTIESLIEALYKADYKAEIVNGRIVRMSHTGDLPSSAALAVTVSLRAHARRTGHGRAYGDGAAFLVICQTAAHSVRTPLSTAAGAQA